MNTDVPTGAPPKTTNWVNPSSELTPTSNGYACVGESHPSDDSVTVADGLPSSLMVAESPAPEHHGAEVAEIDPRCPRRADSHRVARRRQPRTETCAVVVTRWDRLLPGER